jgi:hypothetical protein
MESPSMSKFIKSYRSLVADLDHNFKEYNWMGYKHLVFCTVLILGQLGYSVYLAF